VISAWEDIQAERAAEQESEDAASGDGDDGETYIPEAPSETAPVEPEGLESAPQAEPEPEAGPEATEPAPEAEAAPESGGVSGGTGGAAAPG
jgi:hypothetical protein